MRRELSLRLPQAETVSSRCPWGAKRLLLVATWVSCCLLLVLLLLGEVHFLPSMRHHSGNSALPVDFRLSTRYLRQSTATSSTSLTGVLDVAVQNSTASNASAETAEQSLEDLWQELRFTPVLKTASRSEYEILSRDTHYEGLPTHPATAAAESTVQKQPLPAPLVIPQLSNEQHPDIAALLRHARDAIQYSITEFDARSAYIAAFQQVEPPYPDSPWHVEAIPSTWQHKQHMGAAFEETTAEDMASSSASSSTAPNDLAQQQYLSRTHNATSAAQKLMTHGLMLLKASQKLAHCGTDDSSMPQQGADNRVLLAAVLTGADNRGSAAVGGTGKLSTVVDAVPNFILQVAMLAVQSQPGALFVSIVQNSSSSSGTEAGGGSTSSDGSSNSSTSLSYWIDLLRLLLLPLRVPLLVTDAAGWQQQQQAGTPPAAMQQQAALRNVAINSFFPRTASQELNCSINSESAASTDAVSSSSESTSRTDSGSNVAADPALQLAACFEPDTVLFVDSGVLFCKADLQRLLLHRQADVACGFDLRMAESAAAAAAAIAGGERSQQAAAVPAASSAAEAAPVAESGAAAVMHSSWQRQLLQQNSVDFGVLDVEQIQQQQQQLPNRQYSSENEGTAPAPHRQLQQQPHLLRSAPGRPQLPILAQHPFYYGDAAVARLASGDMFDVLPPYVPSDLVIQSRLAAGVPVQVYCCWSGLAKVSAEPFRRGLRFRSHQPAECKSTSENLFCDDLHRLGYSKILIDSGVLVTHQLALSARLSNSVKHGQRMPYIRRSRWVEVQGAGSPWLLDQQQLQEQTYKSIVCCEDSGDSREDPAQPQGSSTITSGRSLKGLWGLSSGSSSTGAAADQGSAGYASAVGFGGFSEDIVGGFSGRGSWGAEGTNGSSGAAAASAATAPAPAAAALYSAGPLTLEEYLAAAAALPVGKASAVRVAAAVRWRASMKAGAGAAAAVAAAGRGVQQCRLVDIMTRNYTEGYLWQIKQAQQQQRAR